MNKEERESRESKDPRASKESKESKQSEEVKKFQNGWTREVERLMAEWADKAVCYRWMHEKTERVFHTKDLAFMFPVIILSTVTGAANFALNSVITDPTEKNYAQLGLGALSIMTGIISTIANRLAYGSGSEAHKGAAISWGKFQRLIGIELSLHPDERSECMFFLKLCRTELDRLIESSPTIPDSVIAACRLEFAGYPKVRKPESVGDIDTTAIFDDKGARLKKLASEAALTIQQKKGILKQLVLDDLSSIVGPLVTAELKKSKGPGAEQKSFVQKHIIERAQEVKELNLSAVVSEMKKKLAASNESVGPAPSGIGTLGDDVIVHVDDHRKL